MTSSGAISFRLYDVQDDFVADERRYVAFVGGRGSGKTYAGSVKAVLRAMRGGLGVIAAPSFPMLQHGAKRQFLDRLNETGVLYRRNKQLDTVEIPAWDAEVLFATLETESRVRGPNFSWGWADEVEYVSDREIWQALKGAVRVDDYQLFVTSTPKGRRLIWDEWVVGADDRHALYRATTYDNVFIDAADYVQGLGYTGRFKQQEIDAEFVAFEGLVYPGFDPTRNVKAMTAEELAGWRTVLGLDVGTRNPTSLLTVRYAGDRRHVERELYRRAMSSDDITEAVEEEAKRSNPEWIVVDPSAAGLIKSLQQRGLSVRKADNDVKIGLSRVTSVIPDLTVDPSCVETIVEFGQYQYPDGKRGASDTPIKDFDHSMDVIRYITMELDGRPPTGVLNIQRRA